MLLASHFLHDHVITAHVFPVVFRGAPCRVPCVLHSSTALLLPLQAGGFSLPFLLTGSLYFCAGVGAMFLLPSYSGSFLPRGHTQGALVPLQDHWRHGETQEWGRGPDNSS